MSSPAPDDDIMCTIHRDQIAGWRCDAAACHNYLCSDCTAKVITQCYCAVCGATANQRMLPRANRAFTAWLGAALAYPVKVGLFPLALTALLFATIGFVATTIDASPTGQNGWPTLARGALVMVYALVVADSMARGNVAERGTVLRIARCVAATAIVWVPAAAYVWLLGMPANLGADKIAWLYAATALVYVPIAIATSVTDVSWGDVVNPFKLFELVWQLGRRYWVTVVAVAVLGVVVVGVAHSTAAKLRAAVPVPIGGDALAALPTLAAIAVLAALIGLVPYVHGHRLGWSDAAQYADPLYPALKPLGKRKNAPAAEVGSEQAAEAAAALAERNDARKIFECIKEENFARALKLYETRPVWSVTSFDERQLLLLGKAAARGKKPALARQLFDDTIVRNGRVAGHALVALAQLHTDLGEPARATELYQQVVAQYAGSEAAKVAAIKLKPTA